VDRPAINDFRGIGWAWPLRFEADGGVALAGENAVIDQSILLILGTAPGERVMRPTFGCGIHDLVFSPIASTTEALISLEVREALLEWEPRIEVREVKVETSAEDPDGARIDIAIRYRVRSSNTIFNVVYPFYLQRGA
jgi:phage baseplate assembly protein W